MDYVKNKEYAHKIPPICAGFSIEEKSDSDFEIEIMMDD